MILWLTVTAGFWAGFITCALADDYNFARKLGVLAIVATVLTTTWLLSLGLRAAL